MDRPATCTVVAGPEPDRNARRRCLLFDADDAARNGGWRELPFCITPPWPSSAGHWSACRGAAGPGTAGIVTPESWSYPSFSMLNGHSRFLLFVLTQGNPGFGKFFDYLEKTMLTLLVGRPYNPLTQRGRRAAGAKKFALLLSKESRASDTRAG